MNEWSTRDKSPAHTTTRLLELIGQAEPEAREPSLAALRKGFGRFPVVGYVWYQDDYGAPRYMPYYRPHEGTDLFAVTGTPVIAVEDGYIWKLKQPTGGGLWLMTESGAYYYYGHLGGFARGIVVGKRVKAGDLIAYIGTTEDADGTYPHTHFEIHATGTTESINPKPTLDRWLRDAENRALGALGLAPDQPRALATGAPWQALFDIFAQPGGSPVPLWAAGVGGAGSTAAFADLALSDLLTRVGLEGFGPPPTAGAGGMGGSLFADPMDLLFPAGGN